MARGDGLLPVRRHHRHQLGRRRAGGLDHQRLLLGLARTAAAADLPGAPEPDPRGAGALAHLRRQHPARGRPARSPSASPASRSPTGSASSPTAPRSGGAPQLEAAPVFIDCALEAIYPGGDHVIAVGRGVRIDHASAALPLLYHRGQFPASTRRARASRAGQTIVRLRASLPRRPVLAFDAGAMGRPCPRRLGEGCTMASRRQPLGRPQAVDLDPYRALRDGHRQVDRLVRALHPSEAAAARPGRRRQERLARATRRRPTRRSCWCSASSSRATTRSRRPRTCRWGRSPTSASSFRPRRRWTRWPRAPRRRAAWASARSSCPSRSATSASSRIPTATPIEFSYDQGVYEKAREVWGKELAEG